MPTSLTGKRWMVLAQDESRVQELAEALSIEPVVAGVLFLRGIRTREQGEIFLKAGLKQLNNPLQIPGIGHAADRIAEAIEKKEKICIYGDYDVDGVTATSLMVLVLRRLGADPSYFLPHRIKHGYGLHSSALRRIREAGADLLITVDNGISAYREVALALDLGMEVIITDHHEPPERLPQTPFIVNPRAYRPASGVQQGRIGEGQGREGSPFSVLAGVGLAFALLVAVRARLRERDQSGAADLPNLREYLDLVALGTIADVVPLIGENRILVRQGLQEIARSRNRGVRALMRVSGLKTSTVTPGQVGFTLAPRINAAGRMGDAGVALRLLISSDEKEVEEAARILNQENLRRQETEKQIFEQALDQIDSRKRSEKVIVLRSENWHPGVVGIVASRVVERFCRPAILLTRKDERGTGSGRSIPAFSLYEALEACREDLEGFGGHRMAAGLTLDWDRIPQFRDRMNAYAEGKLSGEDLIPAIKVDGTVEPERISRRLVQEIEGLKPFGMGNPEPIFLSRKVPIMAPRPVGEKHLRFRIPCGEGALNGIGFGMCDLMKSLEEGAPMDLLYHLRFNDYNGTRSLQAVLVDLKSSGGA